MSILPATVTKSSQQQEVEEEDDSTPSIASVLLVTEQGLGKRVRVEAFKLQHRGGVGSIAIKCNPGDRLVGLHVVGLRLRLLA